MAGTFQDTWNASFEGIPADTENINLGAGRIRDLKVNVRERLAINHSFNGDSSDGKHTVVELTPQTADPVLDASDGAVYQKSVRGANELFYEDQAGRVTQLTAQGAVNVPPFVPSGTVMLFVQNSAPPGWIQGRNLNDAVLRVVNDSSGGSTGGSWTITGLINQVNVQGHTLAASEIPSHTHNINVVTAVGGNIGFQGGGTYLLGQFSVTTDGGTGGNQPHVHPVNAAAFGDGSWRPAYVNTIFCYKQ